MIECVTELAPALIDRLVVPLPVKGRAGRFLVLSGVADEVHTVQTHVAKTGGKPARYRLRVKLTGNRYAGPLVLDNADVCRLRFKRALDYMAIAYGQLARAHRLSLSFTEHRILFRRKLCDFQGIRTSHAENEACLSLLLELLLVLFHLDATRSYDGQETVFVLVKVFHRIAVRLLGELMQLFGGTAYMEESSMPEIYDRLFLLGDVYDRGEAILGFDQCTELDCLPSLVLESLLRLPSDSWNCSDCRTLDARLALAAERINNSLCTVAACRTADTATEWTIVNCLATLIVLNQSAIGAGSDESGAFPVLRRYLVLRLSNMLAPYTDEHATRYTGVENAEVVR